MSYASTTPAETAPAATDSVGRSTSARYNETLSSRTMCAYGFFRLPISGYDLTVRPARTAVYIEALNQSILTHAMIVSCCKSVDFLLGFLVGTTSDNVSTRWGRRKPWVVVCFPFAIVSMFLLVTPFPFSGDAVFSDSDDFPCGEAEQGSAIARP